MRASLAQTSFTGGEISRNAQATVTPQGGKDAQTGVAKAHNMQVLSEGAIVRRQGSKFIGIAGEHPNFTNPLLIAYADGPFDVRTFEMTNGSEYTLVMYLEPNTFLPVASIYKDGAMIPSPLNASAPLTIPVPFNNTELNKFTVLQSFDTLYFFHKSFDAFKLTKFSDTLWEFSSIAFKDGPFYGLGIPSSVAIITHEYKVASLSVTGTATPGGVVSLSSKAGDYAAYVIATMVDRGDGVIRFTVADNNDFRTGSRVYISGALGTTAANGSWRITKVNATTYDIEDPYGAGPNPTFNAVYTAGSGQIAPGAFFNSDIGRLIRIKTAGANGWGTVRITAVTNAANATATVIRTLTTTGTTFLFRFAAFNLGAPPPSGSRPHTATFHKGRLWIGGAGESANMLFGSVLEDFENFAPSDYDAPGTVLATNAVTAVINSEKIAEIEGLASAEYGLVVGTTTGSFVFRASSANEAITPSNAGFDFLDTSFCSEYGLTLAGKGIVFLSSRLDSINEYINFFDEEGFRRTELSQFARHFMDNAAFSRIQLQSGKEQTFFFINGFRQIVGVCYKREGREVIAGFFEYSLGGEYADEQGVDEFKNTNPHIFSIASGPAGLYVCARRVVNGSNLNTLERIDRVVTEVKLPDQYNGVDCAITYAVERGATAVTLGSPTELTDTGHGLSTGEKIKIKNAAGMFSPVGITFPDEIFEITVIDANTFSIDFDSSLFSPLTTGAQLIYYVATDTVTGLIAFENEKLEVQADGFSLGTFTVSGGEIALPEFYGHINAGFPFTAQVETLSFDVGAGDGVSRGKQRRSEQVAVEVVRSTNFEISGNREEFQEVDLLVADQAPRRTSFERLFTGIRDRIDISGDYDVENTLTIRQRKAEPLIVLGIYPQTVSYDRG